jgi:ABC-type branched-subunit amino acid transport system ATPase component
MLLEVENVSKWFGGLQAVKNATFGVPAGQVMGLVGPNGAGKTTLFNMITGTLSTDQGSVTFDGADITSVTAQQRVGAGIGRTFQDVRLLPRLSVVDNVCVGIQQQAGERMRRVFFQPWKVVAEERRTVDLAHHYLDFVGIGDSARNQSAGALSYGEQKLVSIARVLATDARLLLLDEPTSGLDEGSLEQFRQVLAKVVAQGRTVLLVEHNMLLVRELCDQAVFLGAGEVLAVDTPDRLMESEALRDAYFGA